MYIADLNHTSEISESYVESLDEDTEPALPSQLNRSAEEQHGLEHSERER